MFNKLKQLAVVYPTRPPLHLCAGVAAGDVSRQLQRGGPAAAAVCLRGPESCNRSCCSMVESQSYVDRYDRYDKMESRMWLAGELNYRCVGVCV